MELLSYDFVQRGIIAGLLVGVSSALAGVFLILRRMSFLGAGLSHTAFGGIAISTLLVLEPFLPTALFTILVANLIQYFSARKRVPGDVAIALVFSGGVALAVVLLSLSGGFGEHVFGYLFGNILMVSKEELFLIGVSSLLVAVFFLSFYKDLVLISFSEEIAKLRGVRIGLINHLLISISALVIVLSIKAVGVILASSLLVIPAMTALILAGSFFSSLVLSCTFAVAGILSGLGIAFYYNVPPSGAIVGVLIGMFSVAFLKRAISS